MHGHRHRGLVGYVEVLGFLEVLRSHEHQRHGIAQSGIGATVSRQDGWETQGVGLRRARVGLLCLACRVGWTDGPFLYHVGVSEN